jgi:hypothetical protein
VKAESGALLKRSAFFCSVVLLVCLQSTEVTMTSEGDLDGEVCGHPRVTSSRNRLEWTIAQFPISSGACRLIALALHTSSEFRQKQVTIACHWQVLQSGRNHLQEGVGRAKLLTRAKEVIEIFVTC